VIFNFFFNKSKNLLDLDVVQTSDFPQKLKIVCEITWSLDIQHVLKPNNFPIPSKNQPRGALLEFIEAMALAETVAAVARPMAELKMNLGGLELLF
jgi:hypothetical protein